ncbi:MAG: hypothetical protein H6667_06130 [Ardenticatenaceae bacterium]|nr:hypothetical protein [Ardenticatenaceae bacterium]MCB9443769.1 hypothetical protein [Ardenticatenaceae bacterium]
MDNSHKRTDLKNCGQGLTEYALILTLVVAATVLILAVIGADTQDVLTRINQAFGLSDNDLPSDTIKVTVLDNGNQGAADIYVYAFDGDGNWLGLYGITDNEGAALFEGMQKGVYHFLAYKNPHFYWSEYLNFPQQNQTSIRMNVQDFTVTVVDEKGRGMTNVYVYAYTADEQYWSGVYGRTDNNGQIVLELPDGDYKFRAYVNGQWYWSPAVNSPAQNATTIEIRQYTIDVTVVDDAGKGIKESNLAVYGYTEDGSYTGIYDRTNGNGRARLDVPAGTYQFRVDYRGNEYWSEKVTVPGTDTAVIKTEERPFAVNVVDDDGRPVKNIWVYAFTDNGSYFGLYGKTDNQGSVTFDLPRGSYQFRADYKSHSFWSAVFNTAAGSSTTITLK